MFIDRKDDIYFVKWARAVKVRDHFTCQVCELRGVYLESHHMNSWDAFPDERYDLDNGITLCQFHHIEFHKIYGYGQNTRIQFDEYMGACKSIAIAIEQKIDREAVVDLIIDKLKNDT